jgi:Ni/Fe-hydrogenase subunit HybB-like protein
VSDNSVAPTMTEAVRRPMTFRARLADKLFLGMPFRQYLKKQITPFNLVALLILAVGLPLTYIRFTQGLAATTHLTDDYPWGLWIGVDVLCGVALAAGGFVLGSAVYLFGMKEYHAVVRPAVLTGFLGYLFVVVGLCFDLGRPWRLPYPMLVSYGTTSVMFLVGWHVALYLSCQFVEFCPALLEWLGWKWLRRWVVRLTVGATIFGVILSTLHQSALGGLFLLAPGKLHPLWYTPYLPVFFLSSAIVAGISMVIFEGMLSHRTFSRQISHHDHERFDQLTIGLGKAAAVALFAYFGLKVIGVAHDHRWSLLATPLGHWFLVEVLGFVLAPCLAFAAAVRHRSARGVRAAAIWAVLGIILNRVNVSIIAFNWNHAVRYVPKWSEFAVTVTIITVGLITFRWIVNRMPILWEHPDYEPEYHRP